MRGRILLALLLLLSGSQQLRPLVNEVRASSDVSWLERLCTDVEFADAEYADRGRNTAGVKGVRSAAYVRLAELGTPDSLAAVVRVEAAHRRQSVLPRAVVPGGWRWHPAPHMGDGRWRIDNTARLSRGLDATAFVLDFYGAPSLFIATGTGERWGRPHLVAPTVERFVTVNLREIGPNRLRAEFAIASPGQRATQAPVVPDAIEFTLTDIEVDSDGDGWTDLEEACLGMNERSANSDRDGVPDSSDSTPTFESTRAHADPAEAILLRRAIFAMFGLTGASHALFVRDPSPRLQLDNLPGPVFYRDAPGGVRVTWKVVRRSDTEALVEISDYEGPLAASGNEVTLRRIGDNWYVVRIRMLWIS